MPHHQLSPNIFNCNVCHTRCDGKTASQFDFDHDVQFSEAIENRIIASINSRYLNIFATKTNKDGYPDIEISKRGSNTPISYIEIKGQARTFMSISRTLANSNLTASETVALNLSDLERYINTFHNQTVPVYLVWCLMRRPCITGFNHNNQMYYHQALERLKQIRLSDVNNCRRFKRASGKGDVVNGEHKGVTVNYHFSINELIPGLPDLSSLEERCNRL